MMMGMTFNPPETVPYYRNLGHMAPYDAYACEMRPNQPFHATLEVFSMERGRSAARFTLRNPDTGTEYPMFMTDALDLMRNGIRKGGKVTGTWQAGKRGLNYGLRLVNA